MRWFGTWGDQAPDATPPARGALNWTSVTVGKLQLWHSPQSLPACGLRRVSVPGCTLLIVGCCTTPEADLMEVARRVSRGATEAVSDVDGSRVVLAVRDDEEMVLLGDLAGQRLVFHARTPGGRVLVSSEAHLLADALGAGLDRAWLATHLLMPSASDAWWTGTPWTGVHALRPGWMLHAPAGTPPRPRPGPPLPVPCTPPAEAAALLREALERAVTARVTQASRPTTDLSGGMDSSTITAVAARTATELPAVTIRMSGPDDLAAAESVAAAYPQVEHVTLDLPDAVSAFGDLETFPALAEPPVHLAAAYSRMRWWLSRVAALGSGLHLSGEGGDQVLQAPPSYLADLAVPSQGPLLWQHATGWARLRHQSTATLVAAALRLRRTSYRQALRNAAHVLRSADQPRPEWSGLVTWFGRPTTAPSATPEARALAAEVLQRHAGECDGPQLPAQGFGVGNWAGWLSLSSLARSERVFSDIAACYGVHSHTPFLDDGVLRACFSTPSWHRTDPRMLKPLLRQAFPGVVPPRSTKGDVTNLLYQGIHRNAPVLQELFTPSRLGRLGLIEDAAVRAEIRRGSQGLPIRIAGLDAVVSAEAWLRGVGQ